jgi:hypothetical protein
MSAVKLLAIFAENKTGQTARLTKLLADAGANICWVTIENTGAFGVMKVLVDKCEAAYQHLKQNGVMVSLIEALAVEVPNKPGGLNAVAECLAKSKINLDNTSGFLSNKHAILILHVGDIEQAAVVLQKQGLRLLKQEELLKL